MVNPYLIAGIASSSLIFLFIAAPAGEPAVHAKTIGLLAVWGWLFCVFAQISLWTLP